MTGTASFIKTIPGMQGDMRLYRVEPPMEGEDRGDGPVPTFEHVAVSAAVVPFGSGPETYIFGCDSEGRDIDFAELDGSFRGGLDHAQALRNAGYEIKETN